MAHDAKWCSTALLSNVCKACSTLTCAFRECKAQGATRPADKALKFDVAQDSSFQKSRPLTETHMQAQSVPCQRVSLDFRANPRLPPNAKQVSVVCWRRPSLHQWVARPCPNESSSAAKAPCVGLTVRDASAAVPSMDEEASQEVAAMPSCGGQSLPVHVS